MTNIYIYILYLPRCPRNNRVNSRENARASSFYTKTTSGRRGGGRCLHRSFLYLFRTRNRGRLRFQLSSLIFHAFTVWDDEGRGGRGRRKRKRKRVPCCCSPSVDGAALSVLCSRAARVFLPRAKGKQKTNYKDGAIMWPFPPDCVHTQGTLDIERIIGVYSSGWTTFFPFGTTICFLLFLVQVFCPGFLRFFSFERLYYEKYKTIFH